MYDDDDTILPAANQTGLGRLVEKRYWTQSDFMSQTIDQKVHHKYYNLGRTSTITEYGDGNMVTVVRLQTSGYDAAGRLAMVHSPEGVLLQAYDDATGQLVAT